MSSLRFAILKTIDREGTENVVLELDQELLRERFGVQIGERLSLRKRPFRGYAKEVIIEAALEAFDCLVKEFKKESVRIR